MTAMELGKKKSLGLYIHLPFCRKKCLYCDFCSVAGENEELIEKYASSVCRCLCEYAKRAEGYEVDTIYFGGGTPTVVPATLIRDILDTCFSEYSVAYGAEITCEANPATAS